MKAQASSRRRPVFGPEPWSIVADLQWTHWDLWYCMVAVRDHAGELDGLEETFVTGLRDSLGSRDALEAKLSHLVDLRARLSHARLSPAELIPPASLIDKALVSKARRKVADRGLEGRAMTPAMVETPRATLTRRARMGRWHAFPIDPARFYRSFRGHVEVKSHIPKNRTFSVVRRVGERLHALDRDGLDGAERLSLYRAFQSAGLELADRADDSYGVVGGLRREGWHIYLGLDWRATGMAARDYWADLCDLVAFEDYALDFEEETLPWTRVPAGQAAMVEGLLFSIESECRRHHLDYQADQALQQVAWLAVARRRFRRYVETAAALGTDHWREVEALAESALRSDRRDLAVELFRAADRPGRHRDHLRARCQALTGVDLSQPAGSGRARRLRLVSGSGTPAPGGIRREPEQDR